DYVWHTNNYCLFTYDHHQFTTRTTIGMTNQFFMSVYAYCKCSTYTCEVHARAIRGSRREELQQITTLGATPGVLYLQQL
ncbi:unnamed protein product, partial [Rotaria socialis]